MCRKIKEEQSDSIDHQTGINVIHEVDEQLMAAAAGPFAPCLRVATAIALLHWIGVPPKMM